MTYTMPQYLKDSERTTAPHESVGRELYPNDLKMFHDLLEVVNIANQCDAMKRSLFYKTPNDKLAERLKGASEKTAKLYEKIKELNIEGNNFAIPMNDFRLLHAIIGVVSECGELIEEYVDARLNNRPMDKVNLKEEFGDQLWYLAEGLRYCETTFEDSAETNINKLKARYPDKFTSEHAENRDLDAERQVLESAEKSTEKSTEKSVEGNAAASDSVAATESVSEEISQPSTEADATSNTSTNGDAEAA